MNRFKLLYFVILIINLYKTDAQISDKRLCVDEKCEVPISLAKTLLRYSSPDSRILSFAPNADITIYSKSAGSREDLWGAEINGKRGYIPKHLVRETKLLQKPTLLVDTEFVNDTETKQVPSQVEPDKVQESYEVIDGTTIYLTPQEDITPSSTDSPIQSTALPVGTEKITTNEAPLKETQKEEIPVKSIENEEKTTAHSETLTEAAAEENQEEEEEEEEHDSDDVDIEDDDDDDDEDEDSVENVVKPVEETKHLDSKNISSTIEIKEENQNMEMFLGKTEPKLEEESKITPSEKPQVVPEDTSNPNNDEATTPPTIEVTTLSPEFEVPQPLDDNIIEMTENPLEVTEESANIEDNVPTTLPPFSLFKDSTTSSVVESFENQEAPEIKSEVQNDDETNKNDSGEFENVEELKENIAVAEKLVKEIVEKPTPSDSEQTNEAIQEEVIPDNEQIDETKLVSENKEELTPSYTENSEETKEANLVSGSKEELTPDTENNEETNEAKLVSEGEEELTLGTENSEQTNEAKLASEDKEEPMLDQATRQEIDEVNEENENSGFLANVKSMLGLGSGQTANEEVSQEREEVSVEKEDVSILDIDENNFSTSEKEQHCDATSSCETMETAIEKNAMDYFNFNPDIFLYLVTTAVSIIVFLFGYIAFDKCKREGPLVAKINSLEKQLLVVVKENQILQEKLSTDSGYETNDKVPNVVVENLKQELYELTNVKNALEEQVQSLEKELENSTEVGMELNKMLSEILSSENGSDIIKSNVEHLQRQLVEQQSTINSINETLAITNTENHELRLELELSNKKVVDLQAELDKLLLNVLKLEEEKETQQSTLENEITNYRQKYETINNKLRLKESEYNTELEEMRIRLDQTERKLELKMKEYGVLTETLKQLKNVKNKDDAFKDLLEVSEIKAELQLLKDENKKFGEKLQHEQEMKLNYEKSAQNALEELRQVKEKYDETDKLRVETQTKLEVLSNYFKDREAQWQKEISKHEALWAEKEGEATSTTERIKFMQEQLQNYKAQTESLKQEIMSQEIELKSQISVLEKKAHENWVSARQAERKLEEAKQEAAQLRHRLTLRERAIQEDKNQHRLQSPIEQNGDMPVSPLESPASPPLLYGSRDHITKSPPIPSLPPFLPPPPGVPFMPPPMPGVPPFIPPPPPNMFPGDHRPPPLGRMSSPPISRYSPSSRGYSPYDRHSSSPSDSEYGTSPPHRRAYSPFNNRDDRREYKRPPQGRANGRNLIKGGASSGSGNSNESLEKINRSQSKV